MIRNLIAAGKTTDSLLDCQAKAIKVGEAVGPNCLEKAADTFATILARAQAAAIEAGDQCQTDNTPPDVEGDVDAFVIDVTAALRPLLDASQCAAAKLDAVGAFVSALTAAHVRNAETPNPDKLATALARAEVVIGNKFAKAETQNDNCLTSGDIAANADAAIDFIDLLVP